VEELPQNPRAFLYEKTITPTTKDRAYGGGVGGGGGGGGVGGGWGGGGFFGVVGGPTSPKKKGADSVGDSRFNQEITDCSQPRRSPLA